MRQHIDAFFEYIYPIPYQSFLYQSTCLRNELDKCSHDQNLLRAICGASARYTSSNPDHVMEDLSLLKFQWKQKP